MKYLILTIIIAALTNCTMHMDADGSGYLHVALDKPNTPPETEIADWK